MPTVELCSVRKKFGEIQALAGASLEIREGEIHALLGENGAGKTTLMRVLYGLVRPDSGELMVDGSALTLRGPRDALVRGIALVPQHFMGIPALSVAENLILGEESGVWLSSSKVVARAREILTRHRLDVDASRPAQGLGVSQQQRLEVIRALERGARLLILDEPTAVLAPSEVQELFKLLRELRAHGCGVVFISHKLEEITELCDRVTVLRAGATVGTRDVAGATADELASWMLGDDASVEAPSEGPASAGELALSLERVHAAGLSDVSLELRGGEILGVAGIDGNGQSELEEVLAGTRALESGELCVLRQPLAVLSGNRHHTGLVLDFSVEENLLLADAVDGGSPPVFRAGWISAAERRRNAERAIARFAIRAAPDSAARALSGGNQQKLSIARALAMDPGVLAAFNPCRGLDQGAIAFVRGELLRTARSGGAVLLVSTDLDEILQLSDRILVLFRGRLVALPAAAGSSEIGAAMLGVT